MRRLLPWALLALLGVGVAAGAAFGQAEAPTVTPGQWVDGVLAATSAAGSAHFHFSLVTTSHVPSQSEHANGTGFVDFTNGNYRVSEMYRQLEMESTNGGAPQPVEQVWGEQTIAIGQTVYRNFGPRPHFSGWTASHFPRQEHAAFGLDAANGAENAVSGLAGFTPVAAVHAEGAGAVDGVAATRYRITDEPLYICGRHGRTVTVHRFAPTTVWVDGQGRLLQARVSQYTKGGTYHGPPEAGGETSFTIAPSTTIATLTFSDFGAPVRITAPVRGGNPSKSTTISLQATGSTTPCGG